MSDAKVGNVRASLVELHSRKIKIDKSKDGEVYWNGENNLYPSEIELIVANSPTASRAAKIMGKFISGRGLKDETKDVKVNDRKNYKLSNIAALAGHEAAIQGGAFFHVAYGFDEQANIKQKALDILDYTKCRLAKEDDEKNEGKIIYKDYTEKAKAGQKTTFKWFYPYNPNAAVVLSQINADHIEKGGSADDELAEKIKHYRGQVYYWNLTPRYKYAMPPVDSVYNPADSEYRIDMYVNKNVRSGFLGKLAVLTQGLDEEKAEQIERDIASWLGAENSDSVFHLDVERAEDLDKVLKVNQIKAQFDEKLFTETNKNLQQKILGAFNSIPEILVVSSDGALFGASGDALKEAKLFYSEQTEDERWKLSETLTYLGFPCEIEPIIKIEVTEQDAESKRQEAQAQLRGSVGGVTALIALQQSVSQGYTQIQSAIEIIKNIYGIDEVTASKMIGDPVKTEPATTETTTTV